MKISSILILSVLTLSGIKTSAQLPAIAEDISPLLFGEIFPDMTLAGLDETVYSIEDLVKEKPAILIFYRGGWCPYCNHHLKEVGELESEILRLGYQIIGISPDNLEELNHTVDKNELKYTLLSDADGQLAKAIGIAFQAPDRYEERLAKYSGGKNPGFLPVPSVFVLGSNQEILFEYINPNYKQRLNGDLLLAVLKALQNQN